MKREIKFRAWDGKKMHFNTIVGNGQVIYIPDAIGEYRWYSQAELIPMQYTGLKDKNGVEIYEGDIIRYVLAEGLGEPEIRNCEGEVKYSPYGFFTAWYKDMYIIGNIHQNPELL